MLRRLRFVPLLLVLALAGSAPFVSCASTPTSGGGGGGGGGGSRCCRVCREGKACGDSCIARHLNCTKGAGCACNG